MTTGLRRPLAIGSVLFVAAFVLVWPTAPIQAEEDTGRMVLVLDSSGSMKERANGGETKIAAAKKALDRVIGSLPEDRAVGLRVYGAEVFTRNDPGACQDSQLVVPVESGNHQQLRQAIRGYKPYGETPIGYALQEAAKDLGNEGKRTIVLVSDGEPTCDPDPCEVAGELSKKGVSLTVDVVGLDVSTNARRQLQCIAGAGNGTYYDVSSSEELAASLEKLASRAARPYTEIGQPVTGTPTADGAPTIDDGDWLDQFGTTEQELTKTYVVERTIPGSTMHVSASVRTATASGEKIDIALATPDGEDCGNDSDFTQLSAGQLISAGAVADNLDSFGSAQPDSPCTQSDTVVATVTNDATSGPGPRPLEIRVIEEPPVADPASLPQPGAVESWTAPPSGSASGRTTGGSSFADAPTLEPGVYRDTLVPGEVLTYAVDLEWGQSLSAVADFPKPGAKLEDAIGQMDMFARVDIAGPSRQQAESSGAPGAPTSESFMHTGAQELGAAAGPVAYLQRTASSGQGAALAGRYTVTLFLEPDPDGESYLIPFTLRLGVNGEPTDGPTYIEAEANPSPEPSEEPSPYGGADGDDGADEQEVTNTSGSTDDGPGIGLVLGVLGVLALAGAGYLAVRRRSSTA